MLGVRHGITNDALQKHLENVTSLLIDKTGNALNTATTSQTPNGRLVMPWMLSRNTLR